MATKNGPNSSKSAVSSPKKMLNLPDSPPRPWHAKYFDQSITPLSDGYTKTSWDYNTDSSSDSAVDGSLELPDVKKESSSGIDWSITYPFMAPEDRYPGGWVAYQKRLGKNIKPDQIWDGFEKEKEKERVRARRRALAKVVRELDELTSDEDEIVHAAKDL